MAVLTATTAVDMTDWNFDNISGGPITVHSGTKYAITGQDGLSKYEFTGVGLTYDGSNHLTGGIVTGYRVFDTGGNTLLSVSGLNLGGAAVQGFIDTDDAGGAFENAAFAHENTITGSSQDDVLQGLSPDSETIYGGDGNDTIIDISGTLLSLDNIFGGSGDDTLYVGAHWEGNIFDGGDGYDTMIFDGEYPVGINIGNNVTNIDQVIFAAGHNYHLVDGSDDLVAAEATLRVDASALAAGQRAEFDGSSETDGSWEFLGGAGNDIFRGGDGNDTFWLDTGGRDRVFGGEGADMFFLGNRFQANDRINGGPAADAGSDVLVLDGASYGSLVLDARTLRNVAGIEVTGGHDYDITFADGNVAAGKTLTLIAISLTAADSFVVDASAETDGAITLIDGQGDDTLTTGAGDDQIILTTGHNLVQTGAGDDKVSYLSNGFNAAEQLNGGAGHDVLDLIGDYSGGVTLLAATLVGFEEIEVEDGFSYSLVFNDAIAAAGTTFVATAAPLSSPLSEEFSFAFDGSAELDAKFELTGGDGEDTLIGGTRNDTITGGLGQDLLRGGIGNDVYVYATGAESTGIGFDTIDGFDANGDKIDTSGAVGGVDPAVNGGRLNNATFEADLAAKVDALHLLAGDAVLFTPGTGDHGGETFLIVDQNATAGYQAGDLVIQLTNATHLAGLAAADFI